MSSDLAQFLLARIAEDEAVARDFVPEEVDNPSMDIQRWIRALGRWVTLYDARRALAECEAKRRLVKSWAIWDAAAGGYPGTDAGMAMGLENAIAHLAIAYAPHPDYRDEWRP